MENTFHWGILGLGKIAHKFAEDLARIPDAKLVAVGSRSADRARAFADQYGAEYAAGRYDDLFNGPRLDAVYIATPHTSHAALTLRCLELGVPTLCEKPLAPAFPALKNMVDTARSTGTYLMEALWSRFLPQTLKMLELLEAGAIGEVQSVRADFGFRAPDDPASRLWDPALGGGALLDIGIYPLWLAYTLLGVPEEVTAMARKTDRGVDSEITVVMRHAGGKLSHSHATLLGRTKTEALVHGTEASLHLHPRFHEPTSLSLLRGKNDPPENHWFQYDSNGYRYEAEAVMADVRAGRRENALWSLDDSLALHGIIDRVFAAI